MVYDKGGLEDFLLMIFIKSVLQIWLAIWFHLRSESFFTLVNKFPGLGLVSMVSLHNIGLYGRSSASDVSSIKWGNEPWRHEMNKPWEKIGDHFWIPRVIMNLKNCTPKCGCLWKKNTRCFYTRNITIIYLPDDLKFFLSHDSVTSQSFQQDEMSMRKKTHFIVALFP